MAESLKINDSVFSCFLFSCFQSLGVALGALPVRARFPTAARLNLAVSARIEKS